MDEKAVSGYVRVADVQDIPRNEMRAFEVSGQKLLVADVEGRLYAVENRCPHRDYPLFLGSLQGRILTCGFHYNKFDVTTGEALGPVTRVSLKTYEIKTKDSSIYIKM